MNKFDVIGFAVFCAMVLVLAGITRGCFENQAYSECVRVAPEPELCRMPNGF